MLDAISKKVNRTMDHVDRFQRSKAPLAVINGVLKKFSDDRGSQLAKLLAYNGFFSMFPLLLASVSVLGIVLRNNADLRDRMLNSALSSVPVLGSDLDHIQAIRGDTLVLVVSIFLAFWAGLGLLDMLQEALNTVWNVPRYKRPGWVPRRLRAMLGAISVGICAGISGAGNMVLNSGVADPWRPMIGAIFPIFAGAFAFFALHRVLCARNLGFREQLPGAIVVALGWWGLFSLGNFYFNRVVKNASDTYGAFAVVLGLLSWSYLLGMMFIYSTEVASVLADRLWPRSLTGREFTAADETAIEITAQREVKTALADVSVELNEPADESEESPDPDIDLSDDEAVDDEAVDDEAVDDEAVDGETVVPPKAKR